MAKKITNTHNEWLKLIEISGPFLSMKVLTEVFPQGLNVLDTPEIRHTLKRAYGEWQDAQEFNSDRSVHLLWIKYVLNTLLRYGEANSILSEGQSIPESLRLYRPGHFDTISPDLVVTSPAFQAPPSKGDFAGEEAKIGSREPRMLVKYYPRKQKLDSVIKDVSGFSSPVDLMIELCRATGVKLGLVTNGEALVLIHAPVGETATYATWYSNLWIEEPVTLRAFMNLLDLQRFFGVAEKDQLESLFSRSSEDQQEVTDQLGRQVREAVEILVQTFDRIDKEEKKRELLKDTPENEIYEAALAIMMRLVLMFCAEERGLFPLNNLVYNQNYALSALRAQLRENADKKGEEVLERHHDAWSRLLATFRVVHSGVKHDYLTLPAYGGSLFNPDRFPFLEGRSRGSKWKDTPANPLPVDNRTVLHLLEALQVLRIDTGSGKETRYLSFRALDPEQIGHVYEGLLDHTVKQAKEPIIGIIGTTKKGKDLKPEVGISTLEDLLKKGENELIKYLTEKTGKADSTLKKDLGKKIELQDYQSLRSACHNDEDLLARIEPFAGLIRKDTFDHFYVVHPGGYYVTEGTDRRSTGTHYTPRSLSEPVVKYTLEPLVYIGVAEGKPENEWVLKSPKEILDLKVCDIAMGSGAFLVQSCRYLSERLVEAWAHTPGRDVLNTSPPLPVITVYGEISEGDPLEQLVPADPEERLIFAKRLVATHCLYGVDKNHMAVEMAKLSMWLTTLDQNKPFTFLDHNLRCGDSLLGIADIQQIENFHLYPEKGLEIHRWVGGIRVIAKKAVDQAIELRKRIEALPAYDIRGIEEKEYLLKESEKATEELKLYADLLVGAGLHTAGKKSLLDGEIQDIGLLIERALDENISDEQREQKFQELRNKSKKLLGIEPSTGQERKPFHWIMEFPEVFIDSNSVIARHEAISSESLSLRGTKQSMSLREGTPKQSGFDGIVGNPPFLGGKKITDPMGDEYREYLVEYLANNIKGNADLCSYFFLRISKLLNEEGVFGLIATNTIAQGDSREVGLEQIVKDGHKIIRAVQSQQWPGVAILKIALVWFVRKIWKSKYILDSKEVKEITTFLNEIGSQEGEPYKLKVNENKSFQGSIVLGMGFVLTQDEAQFLIAKNPKNKDVLFPYINGEDLNSSPNQSASRWVINFFDWPLNKETAPNSYNGMLAANYPDCLSIIEEKVKPERTRKNEIGEFVLRKPLPEKWWIYADKRPALYSTIKNMERVLVISLINNHLGFAFEKKDQVFAHKLAVFPISAWGNFSVLQSNFHYQWAWNYSSTNLSLLNYSPSDVFETFPFPESLDSLEEIGKEYYQYRQSIMQTRQEGLTKTYNRFHNQKLSLNPSLAKRGTSEDDENYDIVRLRELHVEMDKAVAKAYGWDDLDLGHGFHETKQGIRFTVSESARREILDRLLKLNHERYAEEVAQGLHDKNKKKEKSPPKPKKKEENNILELPIFSEI